MKKYSALGHTAQWGFLTLQRNSFYILASQCSSGWSPLQPEISVTGGFENPTRSLVGFLRETSGLLYLDALQNPSLDWSLTSSEQPLDW